MDPWGTLLAAHARYQQAAGRSAGTIRLYRYRLLDVAAVHPDPAAVTADDLIAFLATPGWKPDTRKSVRTAYRSFFSWAYKSGRLPTNPSADLPAVKVARHLPRPAPEHVVAASMRTATDREAFMIGLGAYAGLRCCEIARVHSDDWDGLWLRVLGKGQKWRKVPIAEPDLRRRLDRLDGWAFPSRWTGDHLVAGTVTRLLSAALAQTYTGHTLRHRFGTRSVEGTKDIQAVAETMGHASLNTTQLYCQIGQDRLLAVAAAAAA